jgi:hypothetical protein
MIEKIRANFTFLNMVSSSFILFAFATAVSLVIAAPLLPML